MNITSILPPGTTPAPTVSDFNVTFHPTVTVISNTSVTYKSSTINITSTNCCFENYTQYEFNFSTPTTLTTNVETSTEPVGESVTVTESVHKYQVCHWELIK